MRLLLAVIAAVIVWFIVETILKLGVAFVFDDGGIAEWIVIALFGTTLAMYAAVSPFLVAGFITGYSEGTNKATGATISVLRIIFIITAFTGEHTSLLWPTMVVEVFGLGTTVAMMVMDDGEA